ncbi:MAG TPA: response regulator [Bacteroidota bacterium]|nr:response regulator [Bacteroidota bacterium]
MKQRQNSDIHIVIAEDEERLLDSMVFMLKRKGYRVSRAGTGAHALAIISRSHADGHPVDLLITDQQMPCMDGEALIKAIRKFDRTMRILVVTGFGDKDLVVRLMRLGCRDFIDKPFGLVDLEQHVEGLLEENHLELVERERRENLALAGERARSLVHDLGNMMCTTLGYADLALKDLEEEHPARRKLSKLIASATIAGEISTKLMKVKAGRGDSIKTVVDMRTIVLDMACVLTGIAPETVEIRNHLPEREVPYLVDTERIQQALLNLGMNALDAMAGGGRLTFTLTTNRVPSSPDTEPVECVCISVSDTGEGMSEATLQKILTHGFTTKSNGHGIGLTAVKAIVADHGGWIDVRSLRGVGSEFRLFLPHQEAPQDHSAAN